MTRTTFDPVEIRLAGDRARGHAAYFAEVPLEIPMMPSGGVYTSAAELARFVQLHLNRGMVDGAPLVDEQLLEQMYTVPFPLAGQTEGYGLGVMVEEQDGHRWCDHGGGGFGFGCAMRWSSELDLGAVVLAAAWANPFVIGAGLGDTSRLPPAMRLAMQLPTVSLCLASIAHVLTGASWWTGRSRSERVAALLAAVGSVLWILLLAWSRLVAW